MYNTIRLIGFFILLFSALSLSAKKNAPAPAGHRIEITNIEVIKLKSKSFQIYVDVVNTGRFDISMGKDKRLPYLEVGFDQSLEETGLTEHQDAIRKKLLEQKIKVKIGETKKRVFLKVKTNKKADSAPKYILPPPVVRNAPSPTVADNENKLPEESAKKELPKVKEEKKEEEKTKEKEEEKSDESSFFLPTFKKKSLDEIVAEKEACPDLIIESAKIIKHNSKKATIEYVLKNIGKGDAELYDNSDKKDDPLAVRAYISGSPELSKGSFAIDGTYITEGAGIIRGILSPDQSMTVTVELDIRRKTRYMPIVILAADAFLKLGECDRTNNTNHVLIE